MSENHTQLQTAEHASQSLRSTLSRGRLVLVMAGVMLGMLLSALDQTIVGTAMPRVIAELNGLEHYAWVFTAYMLASTVMVPVWGKLSDIYGRRPFFLAGMILFLLGSALSGTSQTMFQLILFRGIQGLGAGAMLPIVQAIVGDVFPPAERGKWQGVMMAVFGFASIVGPTAGGWITDNWGWRWVFYVNMPVGALAILTAGFAIPGRISRRQHTIDYVGAAALVAGAVPMLLGFSWAGTQYDWGSPQIIGLFAFAVLMFAFFYFVERRAAEPVISPSLFKSSIFTVSVVASFLVSVGMYGAIMYLPLFVQGVLGDTATDSGAVLTPMMIGFMVSSVIGGQILSRTGRYRILAILSFVVATVGVFLLSGMGVGTTDGLVVRNMIITGLGMGVMMGLFTIVAQNAFPFSKLGEVTASLQFFRSIGGTIGVAILGTIMTNSFQSSFQSTLPQALKNAIPPDKLQTLLNPEILLAPEALTKVQQGFAAYGPAGQALFKQFVTAMQSGLAGAISNVFSVATFMMVLATVSTLFLKEIPLRKTHTEDVPVPGDEGGRDAFAAAGRGYARSLAAVAGLAVAGVALVGALGLTHGTVVAQIGWPDGKPPAANVQWVANSPASGQAATPSSGSTQRQPAPAVAQSSPAAAQTPRASQTPAPTSQAGAPPAPTQQPQAAPALGAAPSTPAPESPSPSTAQQAAPQRTYTIQAGDTLSGIAARFYGDPNAWPRIVAANSDKIQNPNLIQPGTVLSVPQ